ncbi:MAG: EutN/CcmL family microcompartment protein [Spirochaetes bacterium]|nr:EutN/CcmL family microcompartment protein [Spirochaetota bacterium]
MKIGRVTSKIVSTIKHPAYQNKPIYMVQPLNEKLIPDGNPWVAVDYVSSQIGDLVLFGGAPGVAKEVFDLELAPIRSLIVAIIDIIEVDGSIVYNKAS